MKVVVRTLLVLPLVGLLLYGATVLLSWSGIAPWSPLNCRHEEIDINSGRVRYTRMLFYIEVSQRVEETWLSENCPVSLRTTRENWRRVNTFSPGVRHSPHYHYHAALAQLSVIRRAEVLVPFTANARREVARRVISDWRIGMGTSAADQYVHDLFDRVGAIHDRGGETMDVADLP